MSQKVSQTGSATKENNPNHVANDDVTEQWCQLIDEWMVQPKHVVACALAKVSDGAIFAAACTEGDAVDCVYKPLYEMELPQEDGTDKLTPIDESEILKSAAATLRAPLGLWIGGSKYKVVRSEAECDHGDYTFKTVFCARPRGGCCLVITPGGLVIVAVYNEDKGQNSSSAKTAALNFGEFLAKHDY